jgi:hypothetical protein
VCSQWLKASSIDEEQDLQLFMDLSHMSWDDYVRASGWVAMHGPAVATLALKASKSEVGWCRGLTPGLTRLRRLDLDQPASLSHVAPVLRRLPQLQHLAAGINLAADPDQAVGAPGTARRGLFVYDRLRPKLSLWEAPDLQQLCPKLITLRLTFDKTHGALEMDTQLPRLLPASLQQLSLAAPSLAHDVFLQSSSLAHLSALQQLTLENLLVAGQGPGGVAEDLGALQQLQQLRLSHPVDWVLDDSWVQLVPKITSLGVHALIEGVVEVLPHLVHLTHLALSVGVAADKARVPEGIEEALAALTNLQSLVLGCTINNSLVPVLEQVAAMPTLRSLQLEGCVESPAALGVLGHSTQLTSLVIKDASAGCLAPARPHCSSWQGCMPSQCRLRCWSSSGVPGWHH